MEKLEYGDINKFLVSIGLVLMAFGFVCNYYFLKDDFGVYEAVYKVKAMSSGAQQLFHNKEQHLLLLSKVIPWLSLALFLLGTISIIIGLKRWFKRQKMVDEKFDRELEKLGLEIKSMTPSEVIEKAKEEMEEIKGEELPISNGKELTVKVPEDYLEYIRTEERVVNLFKQYRTENFITSSKLSLGNNYEIDILLTSKTSGYSDRIIEIKYFANGLSTHVIEKTLLRLSSALSFYEHTMKRKAVPVLFIVFENPSSDNDALTKMSAKIESVRAEIPKLARLKTAFVEQKDIEKYNVRELLRK